MIAVIGDYQSELESELTLPAYARRVVFFPGSTIGNFEPDAGAGFLRRVRALVGRRGRRADRRGSAEARRRASTSPTTIPRAIPRPSTSTCWRGSIASWARTSIWPRSRTRRSTTLERSRIEMHLRSLRAQRVRIGARVFAFAAGETIHTENSYKYTPEGFGALARAAGFPAQPDVDRSRALVRGVLPAQLTIRWRVFYGPCRARRRRIGTSSDRRAQLARSWARRPGIEHAAVHSEAGWRGNGRGRHRRRHRAGQADQRASRARLAHRSVRSDPEWPEPDAAARRGAHAGRAVARPRCNTRRCTATRARSGASASTTRTTRPI